MKQNKSSFETCFMGTLMILLVGFFLIFAAKTCGSDTDPVNPSYRVWLSKCYTFGTQKVWTNLI